MSEQIINDGFLEPSKKDLRESRRKGYVFGAAGGVQGAVINPSGDWTKSWPSPEKQAYVEPERLVETNACTSFGSLNALEALMKLKYGVDVNYSERFLAIVSETDPRVGNDPHKVLEAIRKYGCLDESDLPFSPDIKTREQFYDKTVAWPKLLEKAERWKLSHNFNHEWVFTPEDNLSIEEKRERLKEALTKGSVCVSVKAWKKNDKTGLYYKSHGESDNHWTGKKLRRFEGDNPVIGDSYDPFEKVLEADYNFKYAKILYLNAENVRSLNIVQQIIVALTKLRDLLLKEVVKLPPAPIAPIVQIDETIPPPAEVPKQSKIEIWAKAIQKEEGWKPGTMSFRNNNPGNMKYTSLTASFGAKQGPQATDGGYFARFDTYEIGFRALCDFLKLGCQNKLIAFKKARTLKEFTKVYAHPPNDNYALNVAKALNIKVDERIENLL